MKLTLLPLESGGLIRVRCEGPLSLRGLPAGNDPLQDLLGLYCFTQKVLLNLEHARSIDTSGVSWLMRDSNRFLQGKGTLVLYGVPPTVIQMMDMLHLTSLLTLARSESEARNLALHGPKAERGREKGKSGNDRTEPAVRPADLGRPPRAI